MKAKKILTTSTHHGIARNDEYAWLRDLKDPDLIPLLEYENQQTDVVTHHLKPLQEDIFKEVVSRILEDEDQYPYSLGDYEYFYRMEKGKNYPLYFRRKKAAPHAIQLLIDLNVQAIGKSFLHMAAFRISPDQQKIAFALDFDGSEKYALIIQDIATGKTIDDSVKDMTGDFEWGNDQTLYYTLLDSTHRPDRVHMHKIGQPVSQDVLLYQDNNLSYFVGLSKSKSDRFIFIGSGSKITTEVSFIDLQQSSDHIQLIQPREDKIKYSVDHHEDRFIIRTNENAENYRLMWTSIERPEKQNWKELLPYEHERCIEGLEMFKDYIVIAERYRGLQNFRVLNVQSNELTTVEFDEPLYAIDLDHNEIYDSTVLRYTYSSLKTPLKTQTYDLKTKQRTTLKERIIPGYNADEYVTERVFAPSRDGTTQIPISIIYKKGFIKNGDAPAFLYGYGSYGISRNPYFTPSIFSLLDRGFVYAIAHIRGGGDVGRTWYNAGKFLKKENTFFDFIDCGKYLIQEKYSRAGKIAICGGSAGGLLMGTVTNLEPRLWGAVVALVPFVDVVNTMMDESLPLTVTEYDEWGNPNDPVYFKYMLSYSPYDNLKDENYPPILATGGLHDPRVGYWEPTKWVMKLREHQKGNSPILLKMQMGAGHQGPSGRYEAYKETAFYYSFVIDQLS
ncbi:MAG: S9 family peptidase [Proteobacteria bacterium]|nr:S9 family peptidase [Pseudomonadota bacterium]